MDVFCALCAAPPRAPRSAARPHASQSGTSKGIQRQGIVSVCKEILCFGTMPCRPVPLASWRRITITTIIIIITIITTNIMIIPTTIVRL